MSEPSGTTDAPALDYAPAASTRRRRRARRAVLLFMLLAVVALIAWRVPAWRAAVRLKLDMRAAQQRVRACMDYQPPPNQVVWDETPSNTWAPSPLGAGYRPLTRRARASMSRMPRELGEENGVFDGHLTLNPTGAAPSFDKWAVTIVRKPDATNTPAPASRPAAAAPVTR